MITLEDQIRRYATDVAGPPVGDPPVDAAETGGGRARRVLVAALLVFVVGLGYLAIKPTQTSTPPSATTVPVLAPEPTSWGGPFGNCTPSLPGVPVHGTDGEGLCVGVEHTGTASRVIDVVNGTVVSNATYDDCAAADAASSIGASGGGSPRADGRHASFWNVPASVYSFTIHFADGTQVSAQTFALPNIPTMRFAAIWQPLGDQQQGPFDLYGADGTPVTLPSGDGRIANGCPGADLQTNPVP